MAKAEHINFFLTSSNEFRFASDAAKIVVWGIDLALCDVERFASEMNQDDFVVFEVAAKYCISDCFVDYEGYYIYSKGFLQ